jgi:tetraprenyl-beta-curcumene synthase
LLVASVRYWGTVAPPVRAELGHWRGRAEAIPDDGLRELALGKLRDEAFNAEAGAMLATFAPRAARGAVVRRIVASQVLFDLLDGLTERPATDPRGDGERLFAAFTDPLRVPSAADGPPADAAGGYLGELSLAIRTAGAELPRAASVADAAFAIGRRAAAAQVRMHSASALGVEQLRVWAETEADGTGLQWRELAAGAASSVLAIHALSAAAADPLTTPADAAAIERAYLPVCALLTLLDGVTDRDEDARERRESYVSLYTDPSDLGHAMMESLIEGYERARGLTRAPSHLMILAGVVAYYASTEGARSGFARPLIEPLHRRLRALIAPSLIVMRAWRSAKQYRRR